MSGACEPDRRRQGRPRDPAADAAILAAVYDVIAEVGFAGFTVEAVAARAGVGKATIYRRWPSREDLLVAAAEQVMAETGGVDTGSIRNDLVSWFWDKYRRKDASPAPRILGQVLAEARSNPELSNLLRRFHTSRRKALASMLDRAEARGEIGDVDVDLLLDMVSGTLLQRALFEDRRFQRADIESIVDAALRGVGVDPGFAGE
ncbi:MAG: TetR/AcrR family transcriptional regulator [Actinobacteria bacterium]|nr:TetR/AcrR family transcriptional regulator [Actinomycetota bacterium]